MHNRALPSAFSAFVQYSCSYTRNACCRSHQPNMSCVFTSQRMFGQNFKMWAPAIKHNNNKKCNQLLNTHWSVGIIRGASKQSQGYILHSSLGYETTPHSCAVSYQVLRQSRNAGTKACKGRTNSSLQGNWMAPQQNSRCSAFLLPPHHKSSISVFIKFFFELVMLRLDFVFVCFEEEEGNSLVRASNTAIICHK